MGGARRALNRSAACKRQTVSNPSFAKKPFNKFKAKDERNEKIRVKKSAVIQDIRSFLEIYQTVSIKEYDFWDFK